MKCKFCEKQIRNEEMYYDVFDYYNNDCCCFDCIYKLEHDYEEDCDCSCIKCGCKGYELFEVDNELYCERCLDKEYMQVYSVNSVENYEYDNLSNYYRYERNVG